MDINFYSLHGLLATTRKKIGKKLGGKRDSLFQKINTVKMMN